MRSVEPLFTVVTHVVLLKPAERTLFLLRRCAGDAPLAGLHVPPGGHLQAGETVWEGARREVVEETGVELDPDPAAPGNGLLAVLTWDSGEPGRQGVNVVFRATTWTGEPALTEPHRFDAGAFHAAAALPDPVPPWVRDCAALALAGAPSPAFRAYRWD